MSFGNNKIPAGKYFPVEVFDSFLLLFFFFHFNKAIAFGTATELVFDDFNRGNIAVFLKKFPQFFFCLRISNIANINCHAD